MCWGQYPDYRRRRYIFPLPFVKDQSQLRSSVFIDAGNVYADTCYLSTTQGCGSVDLAQMAVSLGVGVTWYSPMGPLSFSLAAPLKNRTTQKRRSSSSRWGRPSDHRRYTLPAFTPA